MKFPVFLTKTLNISGEKHKLTVRMPNLLPLTKYQVALKRFSLPYSWQNIKSSFNNNTFSYTFDGDTFPVVLPDGMYDVVTINAGLHFVMDANNHYTETDGVRKYPINIYTNPTSYCISFTIDSGYAVIIPTTEIRTLLGIVDGTYTTSFNGTLVPQIDRVQTIIVHCDLINNSNLNYPRAMESFTPNVPPASLISKESSYPNWLTCIDQTVNFVSVHFTDQNNQPLPIIDDNITVELSLSNEN